MVVTMQDTGNTDIKVITGLTLVHFIGDFYSSFVIPLLPAFVEKLAISLTQIGFLAGLSRFLAFIVQPSVGYLADYYRTRLFILGGPFLAIVFVSLVGVAPSYPVLLELSGPPRFCINRIYRLIHVSSFHRRHDFNLCG